MEQSQKFLEDGARIPVTRIWVKGNVVTGVRTAEKNHYSAIQLGFGTKKKANKAEMGNVKGAKLEKAPKFLKEVRMNEDTDLEAGVSINAVEILKEGDIIDVTATSKGKGYSGVVKRHGFAGGPRTHGQSDRERAPGSIGQTTTPGRVYKGKRMAGRMGHETVTIRNLQVVGVAEDEILVKGLVPGSVNTMVIVKKVGESKKYTPLFGIKAEEEIVASDLPISNETNDAEQSPSASETSNSSDAGQAEAAAVEEVKEEKIEEVNPSDAKAKEDK